MLGTNDARTNLYQQIDSFVNDYEHMITAELQNFSSKPQIFLVIPPPIFQNNLNLNSTTFTQANNSQTYNK